MISLTLKELRLAAGFRSLRQLSLASSVPISTLSRLENDPDNQPAPDTLRKLAPHLKVPHEELLKLAGYMACEKNHDYKLKKQQFIPVLRSFALRVSLKKQTDITDLLPFMPIFDQALAEHLFAVKIPNQDMAPNLPNGALAIASYGNKFESGRLIVLVRQTGTWQIKRAYHNKNGTLTLTSNRPDIPPETVPATDIFVAGTIIKKIEDIL